MNSFWQNDFVLFGFSLFLFLIALFIFLFPKGERKAPVRVVAIMMMVIAVVGLIYTTAYQIEEGQSVVVTQFGKVWATQTNAGINYKLPWMKTYNYPKRITTYSQTIEARSSEGLSIIFDITTQIRVDVAELENIYTLVAKNFDIMSSNIITPSLREVVRNTISKFSATRIYLEREQLSIQLTADAQKELKSRYAILEELQLRNIVLPPRVEDAIVSKIEKQQEAEAMEFEKLKKIKEAEIKVVEAKGIADAQKIINSTLTSAYLQHEAIEAYKELAKNSNSTFIIMPTDGGSTGMPMILNTK